MANLNLSEFTEKLFVTDADHTFIWDTVGAISKRVSRNSWLNSGTLTSDAPVTISQTWNGTGSTVFTALKVNATSTASDPTSRLLDLQVGTVSQFNVRKNGQALFSSGIVSAPGITFLSGSNTGIWETSAGVHFSSAGTNAFGVRNEIRVNSSLAFGFASGTPADTGLDVALWRDAANTLALRNGANAQTFNVYGTYTSGASYARLAIACDTSGNATLTTQSTGVAGTVSINGVPVGLGKDNVSTNIAIGTSALNLHNIAESSRNIGIGNNSLRYTSSSCVAIGIDAMQNATLGTVSGNVAVGDSALFASTNPGNRNTGIGFWAMRGNNSSDSTGLGWAVLVSTTATNTCALGAQAGRYITGGATNNSVASNSIYIGNDTKAAASGETNQIVIGYDATGLGSNSVVLGNDSITKTALKGNVGIGTTSPSSKLQVTGGDVEIETVTSGIIMKAAGTATRYRITLNAGGTDLVFTAI